MLWSLRPLCEEATWARYWMTFFVFSVLPAPDSPLKNNVTGNMEIHFGQNTVSGFQINKHTLQTLVSVLLPENNYI